MKKVLLTAITLTGVPDHILESWRGQNYPNFSTLIHQQPAREVGLGVQMSKDLNIAESREQARLKALASSFDYFLFLDDDIELPPSAVSYMVASLERTPDSAIAGYYRMKSSRSQLALEYASGTVIRRGPQIGSITYLERPVKGLTKVDFSGLGCLLVSRAALERTRIRVNFSDVFRVGTYDWVVWADDSLEFCSQLKQAGFSIYMDGNVECKHVL